ncbi:TetR/AcrR family transcriptional regulator [Nocardia sp. NPDC059177]|uniref:TetR/AcrR family transcriptional regulator n=1 Tax=Nocardia sp. NPDC059177 TaxID=3346759 RepID=UPI00369B3992
MDSTAQRLGRPRKGSLGKREAILAGARRVFGRVGYLGASIDMIAAEAEVSTRTIYNHFANKEQLFAVALTESSEQVAAAHEAMIGRYLHDDVTAENLETALTELATEWGRPDPAFAEHEAIVGRIHARGEDFPADLVAAWLEAGPRRVQRALADRLARLGERGMLDLENPALAAQHYIALITTAQHSEATATPEPSIDESVATGVHTFLYGYAGRSATNGPGADRRR